MTDNTGYGAIGYVPPGPGTGDLFPMVWPPYQPPFRQVCPACGFCPYCGRMHGRWPTYPVQPWPGYPFWHGVIGPNGETSGITWGMS